MPRRTTTTLADIESQIEKLQRQAAELRAAEVEGVIGRIKAAIEHYGLTAEQLGFHAAKRATATRGKGVSAKAVPAPRRPAKGARSVGVAKYGDGDGKTWTGVGKRPAWFKEAIAAGKTAESMLLATTESSLVDVLDDCCCVRHSVCCPGHTRCHLRHRCSASLRVAFQSGRRQASWLRSMGPRSCWRHRSGHTSVCGISGCPPALATDAAECSGLHRRDLVVRRCPAALASARQLEPRGQHIRRAVMVALRR